MAKFKVGDKVRVVSNLKDFDKKEYPVIVDKMLSYAGKEFTVTEITDSGYYILSGNYIWDEKWLEPVETPRILDDAEFKYLKAVIKPFMDRVKYITKFNNCNSEWIEITLDSEFFSLPYFKPDTMYQGMKIGHDYTLEELGFAKPKPTYKFKVGDLVKVIDEGKTYTLYESWFSETGNNYLKQYFKFGDEIDIKRDYIVVAIAPHTLHENRIIYAIKDIKGQVYLTDERGLKNGK